MMRRVQRAMWLALVACLAVLGSGLVAAPAQAAPVAAASGASAASAAPAGRAVAPALSGSSFNPGYIISDTNFYDRYAMTEADIQTFLNTRIGGGCANANCLAVARTNTFDRAADAVCAPYRGAAAETTAAIIFKVQQACGISARVLLVTLQKEQGLLTNTAPSDAKVARAMGYACPDSAGGACDTLYAGLYNQIYWAGRQLVRYSNPPGTSNTYTWYPVGRPVAILYHPDSARCGASAVTIQNKATAALYYYTPYQPNAAALANLRTTGDGCSSYGNRNFWVYYNDYFGDPTTPAGSAYGVLSSVTGTQAGIAYSGWAVIPDAIDTTVHLAIEMGGIWTPLEADQPSTDAQAAFPDAGPNHGFSGVLPAAAGTRGFCLWASGLKAATVIGCRTVVVPPASPPVGQIESIVPAAGGFTISGWAVLPATPTAPAHLAVNIGPRWLSVEADQPGAAAADVAVPGAGTTHGFSAFIPASPGAQSFCLWASGVVGAVVLECRSVTVASAQAPQVVLSQVAPTVGGFTISGWAVQPGALTSQVHLAVNIGSRWLSVEADQPGATAAETAFPGAGTTHAFSATIPASPGTQSFCLWASGVDRAYQVECRSVTVAATPPPVAELNVQAIAGGFTVSGWAVLPSALTSPVHLAVNLGPQWISVEADQPGATGAEAAFPGAGTVHAYSATFMTPPGNQSFCLWASGIDRAYQLACRTVAVAAAAPPTGEMTVQPAPGGFTISGWAVLPSSLTTPVHMAVNIGPRWISVEADQPGATAAEAAFPGAGTTHGFSALIPASPGPQSFCLWASGVSGASVFACSSVTVPSA
jgi:hypothetical protein